MKTRKFELGPADDAIVSALNSYHFLTARQVCRLLYSEGSLTYCQTRLARLAAAGYALRLFLPRPTQHGSGPSVFAPARKGLAYLQSRGDDVDRRFHPSEVREHAYLFLSHTLAVNDVLIAAELLSRRRRDVALRRVVHERALRHQPMYVGGTAGRRIPVVPDAWLDFRVPGPFQCAIALELDRGTTERRAFQRKVRGLVACAAGPYQERFNTSSLTIAILATPGQGRLAELRRWTEAELAELGRRDADLFRLAAGEPGDLTPDDLFLAPRWTRPFSQSAVPLLAEVA